MISAASALCPRPSPSTTPAAIAMMFLSAPPISTSDHVGASIEPERWRAELVLHAVRPRGVRRCDHDCRRQLARELGGETGAGEDRRRCHMRKLRGNDLATSAARALFESLRRADDERSGGTSRAASFSTARRPCDGTATTTTSASSSASDSDEVGRSDGGKFTSGRYTAFARRCCMSETSAASRPHKRTSWPMRPRCTASAVPQLPAPMTATR